MSARLFLTQATCHWTIKIWIYDSIWNKTFSWRVFLKFKRTGNHYMTNSTLYFHNLPTDRAKTFRSSARPRQVLSYLGRVDFQKHLYYGTSWVCRIKCFFLLRSEFGLCKLAPSFAKFGFFSRQLSRFRICFPRIISGSVVSVNTGIHWTRWLPLWQVLWSLKK